jgi:hypothetical protein
VSCRTIDIVGGGVWIRCANPVEVANALWQLSARDAKSSRVGFSSGLISFRRFTVVGRQPEAIDQDLLDQIAQHALRPSDDAAPAEIEYGWSGGRHILDANFTFENNVYADALLFALRVDTNKVPPELKKAYQILEEDAAAAQNPSGFISRRQKRDVKDVLERKLDDELRSGKFRRSKLAAVLWDIPSATLYSSIGLAQQDKLVEIFERTFDGLTLAPISSGTLALRIAEARRRRRDYEDFRPTRFVQGPSGEGQMPDYPWVAKGPEAKDFLGNEFLTWMWHEAEHSDGEAIATDAGEVTVMFDKLMDLDCAFGETGRDSIRGDGVARMPEVLDALRSGKVPRRAGLIVEAGGSQFTFSLGAESLSVSALKLPDVEEADSPRVVFEERVAMLRDFAKSFDALFSAFLAQRSSSAWEGQTTRIRRAIVQAGRRAPVTELLPA